jgi:hypothetical protein
MHSTWVEDQRWVNDFPGDDHLTAISVQRQQAQQVLTQFEENPDSWTKVPEILDNAKVAQSKV